MNPKLADEIREIIRDELISHDVNMAKVALDISLYICENHIVDFAKFLSWCSINMPIWTVSMTGSSAAMVIELIGAEADSLNRRLNDISEEYTRKTGAEFVDICVEINENGSYNIKDVKKIEYPDDEDEYDDNYEDENENNIHNINNYYNQRFKSDKQENTKLYGSENIDLSKFTNNKIRKRK